jgi:hypothetical protein
MPEEGLQVSVATHRVTNAYEALEAALSLEPVPWVECSGYAKRRAKQPAPKAKTT